MSITPTSTKLDSIYDFDGPTVKSSNAITNAAHNLDRNEKRIILVAITKVIELNSRTNRELKITTDDLVRVCPDVNNHDANKLMRSAAKTLQSKNIIFNENYGDGEIIKTVNWVQEIGKPVGGNYITILFSDRIFRNLTNLSDGYTMYKIKAVMRLKGKHSIRFFELLMQWAGTGELKISRANFDMALGLPVSYLDESGHVSKVIKPAIKELNERLGFKVKFSRTVNGLFKFNFERRLSEIEKKKKDEIKNNELNKIILNEKLTRLSKKAAASGLDPEVIGRNAKATVKKQNKEKLEREQTNAQWYAAVSANGNNENSINQHHKIFF